RRRRATSRTSIGSPTQNHDAAVAHVTRSQTFVKERRGETRVAETFSAVGENGEVQLSLTYEQGGDLVIWATPDSPNLELRAAKNPRISRWYQDPAQTLVPRCPL